MQRSQRWPIVAHCFLVVCRESLTAAYICLVTQSDLHPRNGTQDTARFRLNSNGLCMNGRMANALSVTVVQVVFDFERAQPPLGLPSAEPLPAAAARLPCAEHPAANHRRTCHEAFHPADVTNPFHTIVMYMRRCMCASKWVLEVLGYISELANSMSRCVDV